MNQEDFRSQARWNQKNDPELFNNLRRQSIAHMKATLASVLGKADDWLFDLAGKEETFSSAPSFDALRALRAARAPLEQAFARHFDDGFEALRRQFSTESNNGRLLSLLEENELEIQLASEVVMDAVNRIHSPALIAVEKRLASMFGVPGLDHAINPLSPSNLANAIQVAQHDLILPANVRVMLFKFYERELVHSLGSLLSEINSTLADAGILPELGNPLPTDEKLAAALAKPDKPAAPTPGQTDDSEAFDTLCGLLHTWRPQNEECDAASAAGDNSAVRPLAMAEVVSMLSMLQPTVPASVMEAMARPEVSLSSLLKQELLRSAGNIGLSPDAVRMSQDDEDAIDLVGMIFDVLFDERDFETQARTLVSRMVVPYVKAAVMDRRMFQLKTHPARRLLNSVSEAVEGNKGEGAQERELLHKAESLVDRLIVEFNEDVAIFETLEQELRAFLDQHRRRIELAERRASEAQRGQERLEQARKLAAAELDARMGVRVLPEALNDFFSRTWTHHLSMIALRDGPDSTAWNAAIGVADSLVGLMPMAGRHAHPIGSAVHNLRDPIEAVLASSGISGGAAQDVIRQLIASLEALRHPETLKAALVVARAEAPVAAAQPALGLVAETNRPAVDVEGIALFRSMTVGTWVQLADDDGKHHPIKLSWVSPISSRLMFVNRRGVRMLVASLEQLAAMRKEGKIVVREQENMFDQALHSVMGRLKNDVA